jgi:hypothetical protein
MEIPMAKPLSAPARNFEIWHPEPSDGLFVTGTWSVIVVSVVTFIMWLVL